MRLPTVNGTPASNMVTTWSKAAKSKASAVNSWVNAITMFSSSNGGATWSPLGGNNAAHVVLAPSMPYPADWEFWKFATIRNYGFFHPSNIVEQNSFYYATAGYHGTCIERHQITSMYWGQFC